MVREPAHREGRVPAGSGRLRPAPACRLGPARVANGWLRQAPAGSGNASAPRRRLVPAGSGAFAPCSGMAGP